ncbi:uncharacterized protein LOC110806645 isoform X2 [Carica papaya]|uniref:uncharacterized protein LOC110806645 isoform X2 n=1 Tax=Carica papaya TaxID=3649 RepID=UPI000B8CF621|nr:uncharacterized protein LOC110806645 isoform X2 [Carica papaya]
MKGEPASLRFSREKVYKLSRDFVRVKATCPTSVSMLQTRLVRNGASHDMLNGLGEITRQKERPNFGPTLNGFKAMWPKWAIAQKDYAQRKKVSPYHALGRPTHVGIYSM